MQGPLQCSEAQVAAYERAITLSTQVAVLAQSVPDAYITPSTDILRRLVAPARDHIAALDSGVPLVWDRPRIESTFSPALLQAALDSSLVRSPSVPGPAWTPLFGSASSMHDAGVKDNKSTGSHSAAAGGRRKAAVPHVNGITSWKGPPLQLDAAARKRMRLKFLEMLRNSPSARRHDADRAAEAPPAAPAAAAAGPDGRTGGSLAELTAGPSRSGSLQSASSAMHVQPGQWSRGLPSSAALPLPLPQASCTDSYHELLGDGSSAPLPQRDLPPPAPPLQVHFEPGHTLPASRPGMRHDTNALCGSSRWEPQPPLPFHGSNAPGPLGWQLLAANRMPSGPPPRGDPLNPHPPFRFPDSTGLGIDNWGYNGCPSSQDPMVPPALRHGNPSGHLPLHGDLHGDHGDLRPEGLGGHGASGPHTGPPAVPPQDMAKLMLRVAQQLGYPPQRMQEVVSCMQRDCRQPGPGAEWW